METAAALKSAVYIRLDTNSNVCTCTLRVSLQGSVAPNSTTACLSKRCSSHNRRLTCPAVPQSFYHSVCPSICRISHRRNHINLQLVIFAWSPSSSSSRVSCGMPLWQPSFSESHSLNCRSDMQHLTVLLQTSPRRTSIPSSVRFSDSSVFAVAATVSNHSNNSLQPALTS